MANQTTVDTAPLLAMPTSRPSLDQVRQMLGGERTGEFAPAYMPEYAGLRAIPAPAMFLPPQFAAPVQQAPVQQAPAPAYGRTFTQLKAPELPAATTPPPQMYTGAKPVTSQKAIGQTASGELIYALPTPELQPGETPANNIVGYYGTQPIYARPMDNPSYGAAGGLVSLAKGGSVAQEAQGLASLGRGGDSMLVHMSPEEVSGLRSLALQNGTDLTINPDTGLPEAKRLKKLLRAVAPILPFAMGPAGMLGSGFLSTLAGKALLSGIIGGIAAPGKGFNFKEGLKTGIMAYAGGKMMEGMNAANAGQAGQATTATAPTAAAAPATGGTVGNAYSGIDGAFAAPTTTPPVEALAPPPAAPTTATATAASPVATEAQIQAGISGSQAGVADAALTSTRVPDVFPVATYAASAPPAAAGTAATGTASAPAGSVSAFERYTGMKPTTAMIGGSLLYGAMQGDEEQKAYEEEMARLAAEEERKRRAGSATFDVSLGRVQPSGVVRTAAGGGIVALAGGGMPTFEYGGTTAPTGEPRMVRGAGDGMSDNVPATIEGVQEARLANDEFVVPADVVADIGNGSSNAGAEKLYAMMDRIRKARHGTTKQPPEINAERYMPA